MFENNGESNEVCLARVMLAVNEAISGTDPDLVLELVEEGVTYAGEVLNARAD